jgi:hypothetical protein
MARGRFINKAVATDMKVAVLTETYGAWATVLHHRIIAFLDVNGNVRADGFWLKATLFPLDAGISPEDCRKFSSAIPAVGLAEEYEVDGIPYLHFKNFEKNQHNLRKDREKAEYPEQKHDVGKPQETRGKVAGENPALSSSLSLSSSSSKSPSEPERERAQAPEPERSERTVCSIPVSENGAAKAVGSVLRDIVTLSEDIEIPSPEEYNRQKNEAMKAKLAEYKAERDKENQHFEAKKREAAQHYTDAFAELIPGADDTIRAELFAKISRLPNTSNTSKPSSKMSNLP